MKVANIVGNGPSNSLYQHLDSVYTLGINYSRFPVNNIIVSDDKVIKNNDAKNVIVIGKSHTIKDGFKYSLNTGQRAYLYLREQGYDLIRLYGFDLMWSDDFSSETDEYHPKSAWVEQAKKAKLNEYWNECWKNIIDTDTIIWMPGDKKLSFENEHVIRMWI